jgi:hypothetical protein
MTGPRFTRAVGVLRLFRLSFMRVPLGEGGTTDIG